MWQYAEHTSVSHSFTREAATIAAIQGGTLRCLAHFVDIITSPGSGLNGDVTLTSTCLFCLLWRSFRQCWP
jgi:hypothetical protein